MEKAKGDRRKAAFGRQVRQLRKAEKWSLLVAAEHAGTSAEHLGRLERGVAEPGLLILHGLMDAFDVDANTLLVRKARTAPLMKSQDVPGSVDEVRATVGCAVRYLREANGFTIRGLAETAEVAKTTLENVENGTHSASTDTLARLAIALGVHPERFYQAVPKVAPRRAKSRTAKKTAAQPAKPKTRSPRGKAPKA